MYNQPQTHTVTAFNAVLATAASELDAAVEGYVRAFYSAPPNTLNGGIAISDAVWVVDQTGNFCGIVTLSWQINVAGA